MPPVAFIIKDIIHSKTFLIQLEIPPLFHVCIHGIQAPKFLAILYKNIFTPFMTSFSVLHCSSKATIFGRRLALLTEDCDLRLHRNLETEIFERRERFYE